MILGIMELNCAEVMEELKPEYVRKNEGLRKLKGLDLIVFDNSLRSVMFDKKVNVGKIIRIVLLRTFPCKNI